MPFTASSHNKRLRIFSQKMYWSLWRSLSELTTDDTALPIGRGSSCSGYPARINGLINDVKNEYDRKSGNSEFDDDQRRWLMVITGVDADLRNKLVEAKRALSESIGTGDYTGASRKVTEVKQHIKTRSIDSESDAPRLLDELDLLLRLSDRNANPNPIMHCFADVAQRDAGYFDNNTIFNALLSRAQDQVLNQAASGVMDKSTQLDLDETDSAVRTSLGSYLAWWRGILAVNAIYRKEPSYVDWQADCESFLKDTPTTEGVDELLRELVQLCWTECLVVPHLDAAERLSAEARKTVDACLDRLLAEPPEQFWSYVLFCNAIRAFDRSRESSPQDSSPDNADDDRPTLASSVLRLIQILRDRPDPDSTAMSARLFHSRPRRIEACRVIFLRAASLQRSAANASASPTTPDVLTNPFRPTGAETAFEILSFLCRELAGEEPDVEALDLLAQAAYYYAQDVKADDKTRYEYTINQAAEVADEVLAALRADDLEQVSRLDAASLQRLVRNARISADAHRVGSRDDDFSAACRAYALLTTWFLHPGIRQRVGMSSEESFYADILGEAVDTISQSSLNSMVSAINESTRTAHRNAAPQHCRFGGGRSPTA